jgi:hypothetical protein
MNPNVRRDLALLRQPDHLHSDHQGMSSFIPLPIPGRLVQEELSVAERRLGVLINRHDD